MENKFVNSLRDNLGLIIGIIIGAIIVILRITEFFINLTIMIGFGLIGKYIQKNKYRIKEVLKNLLDRW